MDEVRERTVRDLPWRKYQAMVAVEFFRVRSPKCGLKVEQAPQLPRKAPSKCARAQEKTAEAVVAKKAVMRLERRRATRPDSKPA